MYSTTGLHARLCDPDHLDTAAAATTRGKRRRPDVAWFLFRREAALAALREDLLADRYRPAGFELLYVHEPKARVISRAPVLDRVVHTALVHLMEPVLTRSVLPESFACRRGLGTHRAVLRLLALVRRHRFAVHLDVRGYFPSIDLDLLRGLLRRRIRDERFLAVVDAVLEAGARVYATPRARAHARLSASWPPPGRGLPIGALTSQLFAAHVYLDALDHFVKRELKVPGYVRYVDDIFLFGDARGQLQRWREAVGRFLAESRHLELKYPHARVLSCRGHLDALGHRVTREGLGALPAARARLRRRVREHLRGEGAAHRVDLRRSLAASAGVMLFG
jgi:hypothetical protein